MKKLIFTLFALGSIITTSCVKAPAETEQPEISNESLAMFNNINPVETLQVPAVNGKITVVTFNGDIICMTKTATAIPVPKTSAISKADEGVKISYVDESDPEYVGALGDLTSKAELWQTLAFEDSMEGDYDYNDLVIHLCQQKTNNKGTEEFHIGIHPIAYGATKTFKLGCDIYYNNVKIIDKFIVAADVRSELFLDNNGKPTQEKVFINTFANNYHCNTFTRVLTLPAADLSFANIKINWFIEVDYFDKGQSKKLYAVNDQIDFLNKDKKPYGLLIAETGRSQDWDNLLGKKAEHSSSWFEYPTEGKNMNECYPDEEAAGANSFDAWLAGTSGGSFNMRKPNSSKIFNIANKANGHFVYQIENGNDKDLGREKYNKIRVYLIRL